MLQIFLILDILSNGIFLIFEYSTRAHTHIGCLPRIYTKQYQQKSIVYRDLCIIQTDVNF